MRPTRRGIVVLVGAVLTAIAFFGKVQTGQTEGFPQQTWPCTTEDEVLVGTGDWNGTTWKHYKCVVPDDRWGS